MSEDLPPADETRPLARLLFGWAFMFKRGGLILVALAVGAALLFVAELAAGRPALQLPFEDWPAFYLVAGAVTVAATLAVAALLNALLGALPPAGDEP
jgi:hypothetical protein